MKKILLVLCAIAVIGCVPKSETNKVSSIKKNNYVYIDCSNCIHTDRECKHIGANPHTRSMPWVKIVSMDSLETYDRGELFYGIKGVHVCAFCVSDEDHQVIVNTEVKFE